MTLSKRAGIGAAAAAGCVAVLAVWWFGFRGRAAAELSAALPDKPGATLFVDAALARRAGLLQRLSAPPESQEADYRAFVEATGFDFTRDLDRLMVRFGQDGGVWIAAAGRFDAHKLARYAQVLGGRCVRGLCTVQGSTPERQISWLDPVSGLLLMAVSPDPLAAALGGSGRASSYPMPSSPVWLHVPAAQLRAAEGLPPGTSALLSALNGARDAMFSATADAQGLTVTLEASFATGDGAQSSVTRLAGATGMLRKLLAREKVNRGDTGLAGVLASGEFRAEGPTVRGTWRASASWLSQLAR